MNEETVYAAVLLFCGAAYAGAAYSIGKLSEERLPGQEKLCREKIIGALLGFIALAWCARHGTEVFPTSSLRFYFYPAAFGFAWASYFLLDFLPARALGGLLILTSHYFLQEAFSFDSPLRIVFSAVCYATGTAGIFLCWKPCLLRDFFRSVASDVSRRKTSATVCSVLSFVYFFYGVSHLLKK